MRAEGVIVVEINVPGFAHGELLGRGGFGSVYRASDARHGRDVAIKILDGDLGVDERRRFDRERAAMGALGAHPNIVPVFDSGYTEDGRAYLVMEFAPGDSLRRRLDADGPFEWQDAASIVAAVSHGVAAAHAAEILHRDIKPDNILIDSYGNPKLADFGIATVVSGATTTKGASTTLAHAAPELLEGLPAAQGMDVYALGSTLHNLISGLPPFARPDDELAAPMLRRILSDPPPDLRPLGVPDAVAAVVEQALAKDPAERQPSAEAFAEQLESAISGALTPTSGATTFVPRANLAGVSGSPEASTLPPGPLQSPEPLAGGLSILTPGIDETSDRKRGRIPMLVGIAAVLTLVVAGAAFALAGGEQEPTTEVAGPTITTASTSTAPSSTAIALAATVSIDCPDTIPLGVSSVCTIGSVRAVEGSWRIPGFTDDDVDLDTVPGSNPIFIEPTEASYVGTVFTITATVVGADGSEVKARHTFTVVAASPAPTIAAPTTAAPATAAPATTAAPTTAPATTAPATTAAPTTAAPTTVAAAPAPSVSISCPSTIALNTSVTCDIVSANASSGSWSLPGFFGGSMTVSAPGSNPIFINPTNADVVGRTFTISATVQSADGRTASASRSFTVTE